MAFLPYLQVFFLPAPLIYLLLYLLCISATKRTGSVQAEILLNLSVDISNTSLCQTPCQSISQCIRYERLPLINPCCPVCIEYGCWLNNKSYPLGSKIITDSPCRHCFCPWKKQTDMQILDGRVEATCVDIRKSCPPVQCVDPVWDSQHCCQQCPNGYNCAFGSLILPAGQDVWVSSCQSCYCAGTHIHPRPAAPPVRQDRIHSDDHFKTFLVLNTAKVTKRNKYGLHRRRRRGATYRPIATCYMHEDCDD